nr:InlB B-repeat-containing protein [Bacteroidales bacterium]
MKKIYSERFQKVCCLLSMMVLMILTPGLKTGVMGMNDNHFARTAPIAITGNETVYTVSFYADANATELISHLVVENGVIPVLPEAPFKEGYRFVGWNTAPDGSGDNVTTGYTVTADMNVYAIFSEIKIYRVVAEYWYEANGGGEYIFETQIFDFEGTDQAYVITCPANVNQNPDITGSQQNPYYPVQPTITVPVSDMNLATYNQTEEVYEFPNSYRVQYVPVSATYYFVYLLKNISGNGYTEIEREQVQGVYGSTVTAAIKEYDYATLEAVTPTTINQPSGVEVPAYYSRNTMTLTYDCQGGTYVAPTTGLYGSQVSITSTVPTRTGYTFQGWYDAPTGGNLVMGNVTLDGNKTLYAHWQGQQVNYTIVYMFEKFNDAGTESSFVYDNSETGTAQVGTTVYANANSIPDKTRAGWEKDNARNANSSVVVAADGSSILYVYYKLREYTFQFNAGTYSNRDVEATLTGLGVTGQGTLSYTMTVKLGQDISSSWPSNVTGRYYRWSLFGDDWHVVTFNGWYNPQDETRYVTKRTIVTPEMLPNSGTTITYTAQWTGSGNTYTVNYWLQNADDDDYTLSTEYSQTYTSSGGNLGAKEIAGFTYDHGNSGAQGVTTYNFYYNRDKYKIDYYYGSELLSTIPNVKFDANINSVTYNWTPSNAQCGVDDDYTWAGWYSDAGLTTPYVFDKMPSSNLVLYGKFNAPTYTVSFNVNGGTGAIAAQTVEKYGQATYPATPTRANYTFTGWFKDAACTSRYDFAEPVTGDITLYAGWKADPLTYTVQYINALTLEPVYPAKSVTSTLLTAGQEVSETAVTISGLIPDAGTKTVTLSYSGSNEIIFKYTPRSEYTSYTVQYVLASDHSVKVHADKVVTNISGSTVSVAEAAVAQDNSWMAANGFGAYTGEDYYPQHDVQVLTLSSEIDENVLVFEYNNFRTATLTINFYDMDGNPIAGKPQETAHPRIGDTYYVPDDLTDWTLDHVIASDGSEDTKYVISDIVNLTIDVYYRKQLTISANNKEKPYDGTALVSLGTGDVLSVDGLMSGHVLTGISFNGSQTDVGTSATTPRNAVISGPTSGADYYDIEYVSGTLTVTKANVTITIDPDRWTGNYYTGNAYKAGFTNPNKTIDDYISISNDSYKNAYQQTIWNMLTDIQTGRFPGGVIIEETNVGVYTVQAANIFQSSDLPSNDNYTVTLYVRHAELEIKPVALTVTTGSGSKTYDGTALTNSTANITGFVTPESGIQETATVTATGSQTIVGSSDNTYNIVWGTANPNNYTITEQLGTLTVNPAELTLTIKPRTVVYNGSEQSGYTFTSVTGTGSTIETDDYFVTGLAAGDVLTVTYTPASGTDVGTYENGVFATDTTITRTVGEEVISVIGNYDPITLVKGALEIECDDLASTAISGAANYCLNGTATALSTTASGGSGEYDYQWQVSTDGGANWSDI